jgi:mannose-6-phosphate isomerase-like protein (cupin superfamily)
MLTTFHLRRCSSRLAWSAAILFTAALHAQSTGATPVNSSATDIYSPAQLKEMGSALAAKATATGSAAENLAQYPGHFTMLSYRNQSGHAELHAHHADIFVIVEGSCTLESGGTVVSPQSTGPGETRGAALEHATEKKLQAGDVVHIPAGVPHLMRLEPGAHLLYFVIKVDESASK